MSILRKLVVAAGTAATATAVIVAGGSAQAAPAVSAPATAVSTASADGTQVITKVRNGHFAAAPVNGTLAVLDRTGRVAEQVPLTVALNGTDVALRTSVSADRSTATMTPVVSQQARSSIAFGMHPASAKKDRAYSAMIYHINNGWNRGGNVSTAVGAIVGLIVGCLVLVGCLWGAGVGAAIGAVVGINNADRQAAQSILDWINTP